MSGASPTDAGPSAGMVVYAVDKVRLSSFYADALGLQRVAEDPSYDVLHSAHVELIVHEIPHFLAVDIEIADPPELREDTAVKPVFFVADIDEVRSSVTAHGGGLLPVEREWTFMGTRVIDGWDPEGNVIQFRQRHAGHEPTGDTATR